MLHFHISVFSPVTVRLRSTHKDVAPRHLFTAGNAQRPARPQQPRGRGGALPGGVLHRERGTWGPAGGRGPPRATASAPPSPPVWWCQERSNPLWPNALPEWHLAPDAPPPWERPSGGGGRGRRVMMNMYCDFAGLWHRFLSDSLFPPLALLSLTPNSAAITPLPMGIVTPEELRLSPYWPIFSGDRATIINLA